MPTLKFKGFAHTAFLHDPTGKWKAGCRRPEEVARRQVSGETGRGF